MIKIELLIKLSLLVLISAISFGFQKYFPTHFLFTLSTMKTESIKDSIALLPLLLGIPVLIISFLKNFPAQKQLLTLSYISIFLYLSPQPIFAASVVLAVVALFLAEKWTRNNSIGNIFFITIFLSAWIPVILYSFHAELSSLQFYFLIVIKSCLMMRILSWIVDRRVYKRQNYSSLSELLEFMFCPVFFIFPGQIQFFLFGYFHDRKKENLTASESYSILFLALWGLSLMAVFSYFDTLFWTHFNDIPTYSMRVGPFTAQLSIGLYWLILIYFQQTAGMSYQVSLARILGYNLKYDMHLPLLTRSPIEYLRKHSSYVKDYIVHMGLKPLSLLLLRFGLKSQLTYPVAGVLSYAYFISLQTGFRPDYERPWLVTLTMILFLFLFIVVPLLIDQLMIKMNIAGTRSETLLAGDDKKLKDWTPKDYLLWIFNIFILSIYKAALGLAKHF